MLLNRQAEKRCLAQCLSDWIMHVNYVGLVKIQTLLLQVLVGPEVLSFQQAPGKAGPQAMF